MIDDEKIKEALFSNEYNILREYILQLTFDIVNTDNDMLRGIIYILGKLQQKREDYINE